MRFTDTSSIVRKKPFTQTGTYIYTKLGIKSRMLSQEVNGIIVNLALK